MPKISPNNTKVALFKWAYSSGSLNYIKVMPIDVVSNENVIFGASGSSISGYSFNAIPIPQLRRGYGIMMFFAPGSKHIITYKENQFSLSTKSRDTSSSSCIRVYRCTLPGSTLVNEVHIPGSHPSTNPLFKSWMSLPMRFHCLTPERWLVSFADFINNVSKTRIVEATTGETVALVSAE
jgi:hypothetical protein